MSADLAGAHGALSTHFDIDIQPTLYICYSTFSEKHYHQRSSRDSFLGDSVLPAAFTLPYDTAEMNTLSNYYTLIVYRPHDDELSALKVESGEGGFGIYQASSPSYCQSIVNLCPNSTELAFSSTLYPVN
jgi:hypothetical protein